jgi:hypothetical protein
MTTGYNVTFWDTMTVKGGMARNRLGHTTRNSGTARAIPATPPPSPTAAWAVKLESWLAAHSASNGLHMALSGNSYILQLDENFRRARHI